jgi:hypothetical protein
MGKITEGNITDAALNISFLGRMKESFIRKIGGLEFEALFMNEIELITNLIFALSVCSYLLKQS